MQRKLIIFELNELPYRVLDDFIARHPRSHFARLLESSAQFTTRTPDALHLHPKISWPTFHRGVPDTVHGILEYNQDTRAIDRQYPRFWELLRVRGKTIGVGASIGSYPLPEPAPTMGFYLPDMFAPGFEAFPAYLSAFQAFNNTAVQASGRVVRKGLKLRQSLRFLLAVPRLGVRARTLGHAALQLLNERLKPERVVRRRSLQSMMSFDVVMKQIEATRPDLATFFSNHVASSMHRYWAAAFPQDYLPKDSDPAESALLRPTTENEMPRQWIETYRGEISFTMRVADRMLGELMRFVSRHPDYRLLLMTSLGQQAALATPIRNQLVLAEPARFFGALGLQAGDWRRLPGMEPSYHFEFASEEKKAWFCAQARDLKIVEQPFCFGDHGPRSVTFWVDLSDVPKDACVEFEGRRAPLASFGLEAEEIQDQVGSSGWHTPTGMGILHDPQVNLSGLGERQEVLTTAFTGAILESFGVARPAYIPPYPAALARGFGVEVSRPAPLPLTEIFGDSVDG